jgi:signal transduction histidine kinase
MTAKLIRKAVYTALGVFLLAGSLMASPSQRPPGSAAVSATVWDFQKEASDLLGEIRDVSGRLRRDADRLESFTRSKLNWQSHGDQLTLVKDHINQMGGRLERLQQIRHVTSPWQQQAIDRIMPIAVELASRTQAAIEHLNENRSYLFAPTYTDHLGTIAEQASTLNDAANDFLEYGKAQDKLEQLRQKLEIGAS